MDRCLGRLYRQAKSRPLCFKWQRLRNHIVRKLNVLKPILNIFEPTFDSFDSSDSVLLVPSNFVLGHRFPRQWRMGQPRGWQRPKTWFSGLDALDAQLSYQAERGWAEKLEN